MEFSFKSYIANSKILKNVSWLLSEHAVQMILNIVAIALISRYLGPEGMGLLQYTMAIVFLVAPLAQAGLLHTVTHTIIKYPFDTGKIIGTAWVLRISGAITGMIIAYLCVSQLRPGDPVSHLLVLIISTRIFFETAQVFVNWFQSQTHAAPIVKGNIIAAVLSFIAKVAAVMLDGGLVAIAAAYSVQPLLASIGWVICFFRSYKESLKIRFSFFYAKYLLSTTWPIFLSAFGAIINLKVDQVMLEQMTTDKDVGIYAAAVQLSEVFFFLPPLIMNSVFPLMIAKKDKSKEEYNNYIQYLCNIMFVLALSIIIVTYLSGYFLIYGLFGTAFLAALPILKIHVWGGVFVYYRAIYAKWIIAENKSKFWLIAQLSGAVMNVALNLLLIPQYGGVGSAVATVISYGVSGYLALFLLKETRPMAIMMTIAPFDSIKRVRARVLEFSSR
jgi:O-antigen/teichoic acid export membrane protein